MNLFNGLQEVKPTHMKSLHATLHLILKAMAAKKPKIGNETTR